MNWIAFNIRWWRWFLFGSPTPAELILGGVDRESRRVIFRRWLDKEPKR